MLPITTQLLKNRLRNNLDDAQRAKRGGTSDADGDGYHDEAFLAAENEFHMHQILAAGTIVLLNQVEDNSIPIPEQFDSVQLGHAVSVQFLNDPWITSKETVIHLITLVDRQALTTYFKVNKKAEETFNDGNNSMVVSVDTLLGTALLGMSRGQQSTYLGQDEYGGKVEYGFKVLGSEDAIRLSTLFDLEP